jgi:hypothetical protein
MLVKQRAMLINTLRRLMAEFGIVVAEGPRMSASWRPSWRTRPANGSGAAAQRSGGND